MTFQRGRSRPSFVGNIRNRVTIATASVVLVTLILAGSILLLILQQLLVAGVDNVQTSRARDLSAQASSGALSGDIAGTATDTSLVQILSSTGHVIASTSNVAGEAPVLVKHPSERAVTSTTISDSPLDTGTAFRVLAQPVSLPDGPGWIYVASSIGPVTAAVSQVRTLFIVALPLVLLIVIMIAWLAVGQSLKPVEGIRRRAADITSADLSQRVPVPPGTDEIALLAATMNDLLARLEQAAIRQQQFVGDASHELRSPLAALQIQLDLAPTQPPSSDHLAPMRAQVTRMTLLIDDLLFLAGSSAQRPGGPLATVDLDEMVLDEIRRLRDLGGPHIEGRVLQAARVHGSARDISRLIRNIGDNAHDHATSRIDISLQADDRWAEIVVGDDGDGIPDADRERVFGRFARLDDSRVRHRLGGGTGLGLSIARTIAESASGTVTNRARSDGRRGTEFVIRLPVDVTG
ncbi:ATP-binding protein [soil metagenome]